MRICIFFLLLFLVHFSLFLNQKRNRKIDEMYKKNEIIEIKKRNTKEKKISIHRKRRLINLK